MKRAHLELWTGLGGDMFVGALLDAGWSSERLSSLVDRLGLHGVHVRIERRQQGELTGLGIVVVGEDDPPHRGIEEIRPLVRRAAFSDDVADRAIGVFQRIAEAEARIHGVPEDRIHFHEIGAVDSIVDVLATVQGLSDLQIEAVTASSLPVTGGVIRMAHGELPVPAPATSLLMRGWPVHTIPGEGEFLTPTAAALLSVLASSASLPDMTVHAVGWGAGTRTHPTLPNLVRLWIGEATPSRAAPYLRQVVVLECQIDDMDPRFLASEAEGLRAAGARDVYLTSVQMKKGRPGILLTVICDPDQSSQLAARTLDRTTTLGVRERREARWELPRAAGSVDTPWGPVRVKWIHRAGAWEASAEADDLVLRSAESGVPLLAIAASVAETVRDLEPPQFEPPHY